MCACVCVPACLCMCVPECGSLTSGHRGTQGRVRGQRGSEPEKVLGAAVTPQARSQPSAPRAGTVRPREATCSRSQGRVT